MESVQGFTAPNFSVSNDEGNAESKGAQKYKSPGALATAGGVTAGLVVNGLVQSPTNIVAGKILDKMHTVCGSVTKDEFIQADRAAAATLKSTGLEEKGVGIINASFSNLDEIRKIMSKEIDNSFLKHLPKDVKEVLGYMASSPMANGDNACYTFASKKILLPENGLRLSVFHEMGHAVNANLSTAGKLLQKCRPMSLLAIPVALTGIFKTKKAPGEEPNGKIDKVTTFVKDNAGKLAFCAFLPTILEEGLATMRGNKYAKELLSPELAKKVAKTNALGFSTYVLAAALSGLGACLGSKARDYIAGRKPVEEK